MRTPRRDGVAFALKPGGHACVWHSWPLACFCGSARAAAAEKAGIVRQHKAGIFSRLPPACRGRRVRRALRPAPWASWCTTSGLRRTRCNGCWRRWRQRPTAPAASATASRCRRSAQPPAWRERACPAQRPGRCRGATAGRQAAGTGCVARAAPPGLGPPRSARRRRVGPRLRPVAARVGRGGVLWPRCDARDGDSSCRRCRRSALTRRPRACACAPQ